MANMRAGLPRLGTVCDEYRLGDLLVYQPAGRITLSGRRRSALSAQVSVDMHGPGP
jgi:hypothetical protein